MNLLFYPTPDVSTRLLEDGKSKDGKCCGEKEVRQRAI